MPGELDIINKTSDSLDDLKAKEISSAALRIKFIKKNIEKSLLANHECSREQLDFLLQRL